MIVTQRLDLSQLLPPEPAACDQCLDRVYTVLQSTKGIDGVHVAGQRGRVILHYDPDLIPLATIEALARREGQRLNARYVHEVVPIEGMDCADCARTLERGISRLPGVEWVSINFAGARMAVEYDANRVGREAIAKRVSDLGYRVGVTSGDPAAARPERPSWLAKEHLPLAVGAVATITGAALALLGAPSLASTLLYALAALVAGLPIARKAVATARATHRLDINALMTIAVIGAAFIGEWLEAATVVVLFSLGEALEGYTMDRARRSIRSLMRLTPAEAVVRRDGVEQRVRVDEIAPGEVVIVRPGERVPVDGVVLAGESTVDQAPITGESVPVGKAPGDDLFAGTINGAGVLDVRVTRRAGDSTIARIIRMVEDAQAQRAPTQRFIDVFASYYTPAVVALAAALAVVPPVLFDGGWSEWLYRALVLLVVACPCALVISTPVTIVSAIAAAARRGVLIKGGAYLEAAGSLRALAFDKTGTLTVGQPEVTAVIPLDGADEADLLRVAAAAERYSEHPLGAAIRRAAVARGIETDGLAVHDVTAHTARGIEARVDGTTVRVGSRDLVLGGEVPPEVEERLASLEEAGQTAVLVGVDGRLAGIIALADAPRPEAPAAIRAIKDAGIRETIMLTGDRQAVADGIARQLGVDGVEAELLPDQKVRAVENLLSRYGAVGMVGDGINDAPALARATVGIAMGAAGTDAALETADIALMGDDLGKIADTMRLSRAAKRVILQNITLALAIKAVFLVLAVGGVATLWEAVFADVGASLLVIANGMRLLRR
ncbi:heavy metal translocating P-type ATPase [Sphaerobacter thermophilus]|uniref:P-type Zn(2+) transporter n=1 Tax=Sphaerobacter thermophilus (strain ATCC 49802 / DSM 20745 / KCCM 41009 / NCIMB 13125 / S 6022) TaxID=479434 RepID=D1C9B9_SPHTD|nr:cation-translocating P-type ATPase [Sphaerobacter thermophilus]ACZ40412.1 heavy metal translocating P-type ATPase [Sphaerobacter thermophilus DSM 20745]